HIVLVRHLLRGIRRRAEGIAARVGEPGERLTVGVLERRSQLAPELDELVDALGFLARECGYEPRRGRGALEGADLVGEPTIGRSQLGTSRVARGRERRGRKQIQLARLLGQGATRHGATWSSVPAAAASAAGRLRAPRPGPSVTSRTR